MIMMDGEMKEQQKDSEVLAMVTVFDAVCAYLLHRRLNSKTRK